MKAKEPPPPPAEELQTLADCEAAMHKLLAQKTKLEILIAERDRLIGDANRKYQPSIDLVMNRQREIELQLEQYYEAHAEEIEQDGARILHLSAGVMGKRLIAPALRLLGRATWPAVQAKLHAVFGDKFERIPPTELDKRRVKSDIPADDLKKYGLRLEQAEVFYVECTRPPTADSDPQPITDAA